LIKLGSNLIKRAHGFCAKRCEAREIAVKSRFKWKEKPCDKKKNLSREQCMFFVRRNNLSKEFLFASGACWFAKHV